MGINLPLALSYLMLVNFFWAAHLAHHFSLVVSVCVLHGTSQFRETTTIHLSICSVWTLKPFIHWTVMFAIPKQVFRLAWIP